MRSIALRAVAGLFFALAPAADTLAQIPEGFEVVRLTDPLFNSRPSINNASDIVWDMVYGQSAGDVFLLRHGINRTVTDQAGYYVTPSVNESGMVGFLQGPDFFGPFDIRIVGSASWLLDIDADGVQWDFNDSGHVVWTHDEGLAGEADVYYYDGTSILQLTDDALFNQGPCLNNSDEVYFVAADHDSPIRPRPGTIMRFFEGELTALTDSRKSRITPHCNDVGQVIWINQGRGGENDELIIWENGSTQVLIEGLLGTVPKINNDGDITFGLWNADEQLGETWLYVSHTGAFHVLPHFGLSASGGDINDRGEIAWRANSFTDTSLFLLRRIAPPGDLDHDCHVSLRDFAILEGCFTGAGAVPLNGLLADCARGDLDRDGDVDWDDSVLISAMMTGSAEAVRDCNP